MVRVAGLKVQMRANQGYIDNKTRMTAAEQYTAVMAESRKFMEKQMRVYREALLPRLREAGVCFVGPKELSRAEKSALEDLFWDEIYPVLTPMAVDASRPYPVLAGRTLNLALLIEPEAAPAMEPLFAFVQVPTLLSRFYPVPEAEEGEAQETARPTAAAGEGHSEPPGDGEEAGRSASPSVASSSAIYFIRSRFGPRRAGAPGKTVHFA